MFSQYYANALSEKPEWAHAFVEYEVLRAMVHDSFDVLLDEELLGASAEQPAAVHGEELQSVPFRRGTLAAAIARFLEKVDAKIVGDLERVVEFSQRSFFETNQYLRTHHKLWEADLQSRFERPRVRDYVRHTWSEVRLLLFFIETNEVAIRHVFKELAERLEGISGVYGGVRANVKPPMARAETYTAHDMGMNGQRPIINNTNNATPSDFDVELPSTRRLSESRMERRDSLADFVAESEAEEEGDEPRPSVTPSAVCPRTSASLASPAIGGEPQIIVEAPPDPQPPPQEGDGDPRDSPTDHPPAQHRHGRLSATCSDEDESSSTSQLASLTGHVVGSAADTIAASAASQSANSHRDWHRRKRHLVRQAPGGSSFLLGGDIPRGGPSSLGKHPHDSFATAAPPQDDFLLADVQRAYAALISRVVDTSHGRDATAVMALSSSAAIAEGSGLVTLLPLRQRVESLIRRLHRIKDRIGRLGAFLEVTYVAWFDAGAAPGRGSARLRSVSERGSFALDSFLSGFSLCFVVSTLLYWAHVVFELTPGPTAMTRAMRAFPVARFFIGLSFAVICWSGVVRVFESTRVNYLYIFEFSTTTTASAVRLLEQGMAMLCVALLMAVLYLRSELSPTAQYYATSGGFPWLSPFVFPVGIALWAALVVFPPRFSVRNARTVLLRVFKELLTLPLGHVAFVEFFLADWGTSLSVTCGDLLYMGCYFVATPVVNDMSDGDFSWTQCSAVRDQYGIALAMIPFAWRAMQTLKMYFRTGNRAHVLNHLKYQTGLLSLNYQWLLQLQRGSPWTVSTEAVALYWCLRSVAALYAYAWDILMDWGFIRGVHRELLFGNRSVYIAAGVVDLLARFYFVLSFFIQPSIGTEWALFLQALVEIARRAMWSVFRVENENVNNLETYRRVDFVPRVHLPGEDA